MDMLELNTELNRRSLRRRSSFPLCFLLCYLPDPQSFYLTERQLLDSNLVAVILPLTN
jgi:hypothetical protein